jgi:hypothetical protein
MVKRILILFVTLFVEAVADVDGDGEISILDATHIQRWLAIIDDRFPIGSKMNIA